MKKSITERDLNRDNEYIDHIDGEVWVTSEKYPHHLFSNKGRVFSLYRHKLLKPYFCPFKSNKNYYHVRLTDSSGKGCGYKLHRIIAELFLPNPLNKKYIHHKDGNELNNSADNLMWVTLSEHTAIHRKMNKKKPEKIKAGEDKSK